MALLRKFICSVFRQCARDYNRESDPIFQRYEELDRRVDNLYWRPRDLLDIK